MKETKEQELKRLEDYWTATEPFLRKINETEDIHVKRIAELKAELKAEMNPKVKSGDIWLDGHPVMYLTEWRIANRNNQKGRIVDYQSDIMPNFGADYYEGQPIIANLQDIFDDLKAIQEDGKYEDKDFAINHKDGDLGEQRIYMGIANDGSMYINSAGAPFHATEKELKEIHTFIGRRLATLKRNEAKK